MKKKLMILVLMVLPLMASAGSMEAGENEMFSGYNNDDEQIEIIRGECMPDVEQNAGQHRVGRRFNLPAKKTKWDATKTYRQLVILVNFRDSVFKPTHTPEFYDKLFNNFSTDLYENKVRYGAGSVADYFRDQSGGLLNLQFDILGPYQVDTVARPQSTNKEYMSAVMRKATIQMVADQAERDFSPYDWDGDGYVDQVVFLFASLTGNVTGQRGFLHPNTSSFSAVDTPDGYKISNYSSSAELWTVGGLTCGIATICHEFTHNLGLPDIYQTTGNTDIIVDEWDLMDGGNITNYGWCPPNYSPLEKQLLGWLDFTELTEATTITGMKPVAEGGKVYQIKHTDNEYYLLENRQQREGKWDYGLPGKGLVVWHVNYSDSRWMNNTVNNNLDELGFQLVHADNKDFAASKESAETHYSKKSMMNSNYLSGSPYPYTSADGENNQLTDNSTPAATMYHENAATSKLLGKSITNVQMTADGLISFDFMGGQCASPTITVEDGKLKFNCDTEGVTFNYTITENTAQSGKTAEVTLPNTATYKVTVYATKDGCKDSETVTKDVILSVGKKGDVNGDGKVSITDAVTVVNIILSDDSAE